MPGPYPLERLSVTIDEAGISAPPFEDILASLQQSYRNIYGSDIYIEPDSQDGQLLAIQALAIHNTNQALVAAYLSYSPTWALGAGLSAQVKINGLQRLTPSRSSVAVTLTGQSFTEIRSGAVADEAGNLWNLPPQVVIPAAGEVTVTATARDEGAISAAPGAVNRISSPIMPAWQSVTNATAAQAGRPLESDATLRRRQALSTSLPAITPRESIHGAIANVPGVGRSEVYDNDSNLYSPDGVPPHSIAVVVEGGDANQIATVIARKKNTGCGTYGNTNIITVDQAGVPLPVDFFYLIEIPVFVLITLQPLPGYVSSTGELLLQVIAATINRYDIGQHVLVPRLAMIASLCEETARQVTGMTAAELNRLAMTYVVREIRIGKAWDSLDVRDITIPFNAAASCNMSNMRLVLTQ